ncbi:MAG: POTRA domain-containing protein, partial [Planctomycetota bacterium]|nr:POTRA domain-containing protein [Planctomycetota bacterium]
MAVLFCDRFLRRKVVAGILIVSTIVALGCQGGPIVRGQSPAATSPPRLLATPEPETAAKPIEEISTASGSPVTHVQIEGNDAITERDIRNLLRVQAGRTVTEAQVRDDVRRLFATRWFFSVEPIYRPDPGNPAGRILVFRVVERPMIRA